MLKPLFWMFKTKGITGNVMYLITRMLIFSVMTILFVIIAHLCTNKQSTNIFYILSAVCFLVQGFFVQGYFWELTEKIINRKQDIVSANIYSKRELKKIEVIELPELGLWKFIWHGFASIIATIMMIYPIILFILMSFVTSEDTFVLFKFDSSQIQMTYLCIYCFIGLFVPALLWNYAYRNSVFAVWNLPKAINIMGNYPGRYTLRVIQFLMFFAVAGFINVILNKLFGINININTLNNSIFSNIAQVIYTTLSYIINLYWLFVYAYILGTIAPTEEA